ncbi:hypothetical protein [Maritimibacter sp. 55A14]|nr:hypothetical protein [Maritimibacter sp. 55A14]
MLKFLAILVILGGVALTGYAYLGDMTPPREEVTQPVTLDVE